MQAYYGKLDAEAVTRYGLQCAMGSYQASNRGGEIFMVFKQARLQKCSATMSEQRCATRS